MLPDRAQEQEALILALRNELKTCKKQLGNLKEYEKEAREEVLRLQEVIRKQRILHSLRKVVTQERHDYKVDNLKGQLSANCNLWNQLAESQAREKVLKQESQASQQEMAIKDRQIERLKDLLQAERREVKKLLDYKATKQKRLEQLETHAREFEVLSSVNLKKLI